MHYPAEPGNEGSCPAIKRVPAYQRLRTGDYGLEG